MENAREKAIIVGIELPDTTVIDGKSEAEVSINELEELVYTAGAEVVAKIVQKRHGIDSAYLIGKGKIAELLDMVALLGADMVVFDEELSGVQARNIEEMLNVKVLDRTSIILDIFAARAVSKEGKLQVEMARLNYILPRLLGAGKSLSRLGGGIGTRGPGETKLETDRRYIKQRISRIKKQLEMIRRNRATQRRARQRNNVPVFALVGYTSSGKSTLLNRLCDAETLVEDMLFATLDTTTRRMELDRGGVVLVSDTVGFIRKLPHELVEAFKSTLEELKYADVLLNVVDASDPYAEDHRRIVENTLAEIGVLNRPVITVLNKCDLVENGFGAAAYEEREGIVRISALTGRGIDKLKAKMEEMAGWDKREISLSIPYADSWAVSLAYSEGEIVSARYGEGVVELKAKLPSRIMGRLARFQKDENEP